MVAVRVTASLYWPEAAATAVVVVIVARLKVAVTERGPFMVGVCGLVEPLKPPLKPVNAYPALAAAVTSTDARSLYQPLAGLMLPPVPAAVVR
jgi:hypothetical protein